MSILDATLLNGTIVIERELGSGATARVYRARRFADGSPLAVKRLMRGGLTERRRFERELAAWLRLDHPAIVRIMSDGLLSIDGHDAPDCLLLEYVGGGTLERVLNQVGAVSPTEMLEIVLPVLDGLAHAHASGVVHRDIKPANILLDADGRPRITDFGLAHVADASRITRVSDLLGTPAYAPAAQIDGEQPESSWDTFAIAAVAWQMLTGRAPFLMPLGEQLARPHARSAPPLLELAPDVPDAVAALLDETLAGERQWARADRLAQALERAARGELSSTSMATMVDSVIGATARRNAEATVINGRFELQELLGRGTTADAWRAWDLQLHRLVTLKFFVDADAATVEHEGRRLAALHHPNIVTVHDHGRSDQHDGLPFLVLEYVDGTSLSNFGGDLTWRASAHVGLQLLAALEHAHARGVMHRDVKPANILVDRAGVAKLTDFGLARSHDDQQRSIAFAGSLAYMSPERLLGNDDAGGDIWAAGVVLFELLAGIRAFTGSATEVRAAIEQVALPRFDTDRLPASILAVTLRALSHDSGDRWTSARDMRLALEAAVASANRPAASMHSPDAAPQARAPGPPSTALSARRGERVLAAAAVLAALVAVISVLLAASSSDAAKRDLPLATVASNDNSPTRAARNPFDPQPALLQLPIGEVRLEEVVDRSENSVTYGARLQTSGGRDASRIDLILRDKGPCLGVITWRKFTIRGDANSSGALCSEVTIAEQDLEWVLAKLSTSDVFAFDVKPECTRTASTRFTCTTAVKNRSQAVRALMQYGTLMQNRERVDARLHVELKCRTSLKCALLAASPTCVTVELSRTGAAAAAGRTRAGHCPLPDQ